MKNKKQIEVLQQLIDSEYVDIAENEEEIINELRGVVIDKNEIDNILYQLRDLPTPLERGQYLYQIIDNYDLSECYGQYSVGYIAGLKAATNHLKI